MKRTDIHRPSAIIPEDYQLVAMLHEPRSSEGIEASFELRFELDALKAHRASTGGTYSKHEHGGFCDICGNGRAIDYAVFYHLPTNTYIQTGFDCAGKLELGDAAKFRSFRKHTKDIRKRAAGKAKASLTLTEQHPDLLEVIGPDAEPDHYILQDLRRKLISYGSLSDKQYDLARKIVRDLAKRAEEKAAEDALPKVPVVAGKGVVITGTVLGTKLVYGDWQNTLKLLIREDRGFKVWGTCPASIDTANLKGNRITLTANVEASNDDECFGFYKRPRKASIIVA